MNEVGYIILMISDTRIAQGCNHCYLLLYLGDWISLFQSMRKVYTIFAFEQALIGITDSLALVLRLRDVHKFCYH